MVGVLPGDILGENTLVSAVDRVNDAAQRRNDSLLTGSGRGYSHSMVAGGLPEMSYTTREMPGTSLTMRRET